MPNPRRQTVSIQPVGAGRMKAQNAAAMNNPSRTTQVGAQLDSVKQQQQRSVKVILSAEQTTYDVTPEDEIIMCVTDTANITLNLPKSWEVVGQVLTIMRDYPIAGNVLIMPSPFGDNIEALTLLQLPGADRACVVIFAAPDKRGWRIISEFGTVV